MLNKCEKRKDTNNSSFIKLAKSLYTIEQKKRRNFLKCFTINFLILKVFTYKIQNKRELTKTKLSKIITGITIQ